MLLRMVALCVLVLCGSACVQRAPLQTVSGACGHLTTLPEEYASCADSVRLSNQIREDAWEEATRRNAPASVPAPTYTPDPSSYTLHTQAPPPPAPMPTGPTISYEPSRPLPPSGTPGIGCMGTARFPGYSALPCL